MQQPAVVGMERWSQIVSETFCAMDCDPLGPTPPEKFRAAVHDTALARIHLCRVATSPCRVNRTKSNIAHIDDPVYLVKFQLEGESLVRQRGLEAHLKPGDFTLCSSTEPYELHLPGDYHQAVLTVPHAVLQGLFRATDDYLGIRMGAESPVHGLLSQFVYSLSQRVDRLEPAVVNHLEANVLDLLVTSLQSEVDRAPSQVTAAEQHLQRIKRFISLHLKDTRLSPDFVARAEGISKRYLHTLFKEEQSSFTRYVQQLRLEAIYRDLQNAALQHLPASEIALEWGFGDVSHFHRCFKERYGITPRQLRLEALASAGDQREGN